MFSVFLFLSRLSRLESSVFPEGKEMLVDNSGDVKRSIQAHINITVMTGMTPDPSSRITSSCQSNNNINLVWWVEVWFSN